MFGYSFLKNIRSEDGFGCRMEREGAFTAENDLASLLTKSGGLDLIRVADEGHDLLCTLIPRRSY